jgi:hypothetical protein
MICTDSRDLPLSTDSAPAAAGYRDGIDRLLAAWPGADAALDTAIAADPDFALAQAARARLHAIRGDMAAARAVIANAASLVARRGDARERSHVEILALLIAGRSAEALARVLAHADAWPRDAVILALPLGAFGLFAFSGRADHDQARVALCARHARHFAATDWWFLAAQGWAEVENGARGPGRARVERSFALRRDNANAVHALAHALFEDGASDEVARLMAAWLPGYDRGGTLHGHLAWHACLAALDRGDAPTALALHAAHVAPAVSAGLPLNVLSDGVSFLWRLRLDGHPVPDGAWPEIAAYAAPLHPEAGLPFADIHMALLQAAIGDRAAVERRAAALDGRAAAGTLAAAAVVAALCRAILAFAEGDDASCLAGLAPLAADIARIGGSHAQRQIIEDIRIAALMRSGATAQARALLDHRLHRRPSPRDAALRAQLAE